MRIEQYISQLLYRYQCVTVPGFGAFLTENRSASLSEDTNTFYPPKKVISFNFHLKNNDGLLANHIALAEKIEYEKAISLIEEEVTSWKYTIQKSESILLKNIGKLSLNSESSLVFEPADSLNYSTHSFGLTSFVSPQIKRETFKKEVEQLEEKAPIQFTPEKRSKSNSWMKYAAIFAIGFGMTGYFGNQWYEKKIATETLLVEKNVQQKVEDKIQQATFFIESPIPSVTMNVEEENNNSFNYHIVAGAFKEVRNAERALQSLKDLGYNAKKIAPNKYGLHPVLYGSYPSIEEAQTALQSIKQSHNKDAWMLVLSLEK
ncbi:MAG TPA: SPOR domain-containing protein [Flavobacterium sp.]|uniref:HU domain-containing protein n=1 Tax=unclassified Flavobacterium TaxID=196869 RepID=UPI000E917B76|nr:MULTISPECIES: SPOR domain-containing protein [unclassified Flavobacterium]HBI01037.1 SPOR domain-containing protein [Flavobacterium sp.]HRE77793.1 SPOR domain-containing protein [Flavobacterium sp.]